MPPFIYRRPSPFFLLPSLPNLSLAAPLQRLFVLRRRPHAIRRPYRPRLVTPRPSALTLLLVASPPSSSPDPAPRPYSALLHHRQHCLGTLCNCSARSSHARLCGGSHRDRLAWLSRAPPRLRPSASGLVLSRHTRPLASTLRAASHALSPRWPHLITPHRLVSSPRANLASLITPPASPPSSVRASVSAIVSDVPRPSPPSGVLTCGTSVSRPRRSHRTSSSSPLSSSPGVGEYK